MPSYVTNINYDSQWRDALGLGIFYDISNVGIGTNNPQYNMDLSGSARFKIPITSTRPTYLMSDDVDGVLHNYPTNTLIDNIISDISSIILSGGINWKRNDPYGIYYSTSDVSGDMSENVGIGTMIPSYKLDISTGMSKAMRVDNVFYLDALNNRVGINKSNPVYSLDVNGDTNILGNVTSTNYYGNASNLTGVSINGYDISGLRSLTDPVTTKDYYCNEIGKEGFWRYDVSDNVSSDNTGTVLVTITGKRLKRIVDSYIYPEWFGAKGNDPLINNSVYIQKALDCGYKNIQFKQDTVYYFNSSTSININSNINLYGNNSTFKSAFNLSGVGLLQTPEIITHNAVTDISVSEGINTFTYSGASSLTIGNFVYLKGQVYFTSGLNTYENGWYSVIENISGNIVTLSTSAPQTMNCLAITEYKSYKNINIQGINIDMTGSTDGFGIFLNNCINSSVNECNLFADNTSTTAEVGIMVLGENIKISKNNVDGFRYVTEGGGYCINVGGHGIIVEENKTTGAKHGIAAAGRTWFSSNIQYNNNIVTTGAAAGIDIHANVQNSTITNNTVNVTTGRVGYLLRSDNIIFTGNYAYINNTTNSNVYGIWMYERGGSNTLIQNCNVYINGPTSGSNKAIYFDQIQGTIENCVISNCYFEGQIEAGNVITQTFDNLKIVSNTLYGSSIIPSYINLTSAICNYFFIQQNKFINNFNNTFSYSISTPSTNTVGYIENNEFLINDSSNTNPQIRLNNNGTSIIDNTFKTNNTNSLINNTSTYSNYLYNNIRVDSSNNYNLITYTTLPSINSFFVSKTIAVLNGGITKYYIGKQTSSVPTYSWLEITDSNSDLVLSGTLQAKKLFAQDGNNACIVLGASNSSTSINANTNKVARIAVPVFTGSSNSNNLLTGLAFTCDNTNNYLRYGGGTTVATNSYAVTDHEWYTANNVTDISSGIIKMKMFNSGNLLLQTGGTLTDKGTKLQINGSISILTTTITDISNYTIQPSDYSIFVNNTISSSISNITLPSADTFSNRILCIKKIDSVNNVNIIGSIDGISTNTLIYQYQAITIQSDGTTWRAINSYNRSFSGRTDLSNGTVTVTTPYISSLTKIFLQLVSVNGSVPGFLSVTNNFPTSSFTITSGSFTDKSTINYHLIG